MTTTKRYQSDAKASAALANALTELPDEWVMCRDMKHAWKVINDFHVTTTYRHGARIQVISRTLGCMRCETERHENYLNTSTGLDKISQHYSYQDGYQLKGIPRGNKPQSIVQGEQYRRSMERIAMIARATS